MDHAGDVAVGDQAHRGAGRANAGDDVGMARTIEHQHGDRGGIDALGLGEPADVVGRRRVEFDDALLVAGADRDLLHVDVGRVQQRAAIGHRHGRDRARHVLGAQRGAFERIDGDIDLRAGVDADLLADEQHRRLVALALADHDGAFDRQLVEFAAHRVDRGLVGRLLLAVAAQPRRRHRRALRHAHDLERQNALEQQLRRNGNMGRHRLTPLRRHSGSRGPHHRFTRVRSDVALVLFDPYHLRPAADHLVALHRLQRAMDRILGGGVGDQDDRNR